MRDHLQQHIKPLMETHPALGPVLTSAGIGCTTCSLGTCRIQDILEIHNLDAEATRSLLQAMGEVIHAGRPFEVPDLPRKAAPTKASLCPPIARMVEEHTYILRVIACLPALGLKLQQDFDTALPWVRGTLDFIRTYADRYHHAKEEDLLFTLHATDSDVLRVFRQDHIEGRGLVAATTAALDARDPEMALRALSAYGTLLSGHIQREDTILFPWLDRCLTDRQVGQLFQACAGVEQGFGDLPARMEAFVGELEAALA